MSFPALVFTFIQHIQCLCLCVMMCAPRFTLFVTLKMILSVSVCVRRLLNLDHAPYSTFYVQCHSRRHLCIPSFSMSGIIELMVMCLVDINI